MSTQVRINEVVTRDGFQSEPRFIPTEDKIALIDLMSQAGYHAIEVTSFTSPKAIPMLADAEAVMAGIARNPAVEYVALIPNVRGAERALKARVDAFNLVLSVSESHNRANLRMSREESCAQLTEVIRLA
ncbi:MAG: hydroxymethylglutaryl-CoA lyase, partial [Betaproteobacteria bacterium]|nr:hydroxymethylglutaryl-CoA lyase [Betaproteobacteria bacterium]